MPDFIVYPAIDLRNGRVVRLQYGDPDKQTDYGDDPAAAGQRWLDAGAAWLHVVNLDGAFGEKSAANWESLSAISELDASIQFGGGIRGLADIDRALTLGATRVILGTVAVENPHIVSDAIRQFGADAIVVGIDARDGEVKTRGWQQGSGVSPLNLARDMQKVGVQTIIHTDISRDGVLTGVNAPKSAEIARETGLDVIGSGGVAGLPDIESCIELGLAGVITGRAIYEGTLKLQDAIALAK